MIKRILYAIPALLLLASVLYFHGLYAQIVVAVVALLCAHEMMRSVAKKARPLRGLVYAYTALLLPAYLFAGGLVGIMVLLVLSIIVLLGALVLSGRGGQDGLLTVLPMLYPGLFFVFLLAIMAAPSPDTSRFLLVIVFGAAIITDTFAYISGRLLGKHKLIPAVSPKKTVEGAAGGLVFGTGAVVLLGLWCGQPFGIETRPLWLVLLGVVLSLLTQMGDLAASYIKRRLDIKDFGHIMGEHGGALDRLDSVLFICPAVFAFYMLIAA